MKTNELLVLRCADFWHNQRFSFALLFISSINIRWIRTKKARQPASWAWGHRAQRSEQFIFPNFDLNFKELCWNQCILGCQLFHVFWSHNQCETLWLSDADQYRCDSMFFKKFLHVTINDYGCVCNENTVCIIV